MAGDRAHWERAYTERTADQLSWYEPLPQRSLDLIQATRLDHDARILDVGGGASSLAARLLAMGYADITVADISPAALAHAQSEFGSDVARITWIEADIRSHDFGRWYDLWHDRAVFHFMVDAADRDGYLDVLRKTLRPGGHLILATFGPQGPTHCSGLPVERYGADDIQRILGDDFELISSTLAAHRTPSRRSQQFHYAHLLRRPNASRPRRRHGDLGLLTKTTAPMLVCRPAQPVYQTRRPLADGTLVDRAAVRSPTGGGFSS
jgi:SAM-dependent methyltransferase